LRLAFDHQVGFYMPRNCFRQSAERTAKRGPKAGSTYLGCENFPKCRFTRDV